MPFTLSVKHLARLCQINNFAVPDSGMIFFGLHGCLPADAANHDFAQEHQLSMKGLNYVNPAAPSVSGEPRKGISPSTPAAPSHTSMSSRVQS